ncbi:hypothetical protein CYMTET_22440 [Cymbomonas tetramitiformis]|uniref:Beta-mannosidase n=1 Tax=Cymbomonas tetramitiformis TaxID=36881 RepID=A0AAE0FZW1_9CHLO|nr:hypothetical protein CYMTET_22440 [Cymbomonas tetramitiformis]
MSLAWYIWGVSISSARGSQLVEFTPVVLEAPRLWWPHTHGEPALYRARCELRETSQQLHAAPGLVVATAETNFGVRNVTTRVDPSTAGRVFTINGVDIFLLGGNWIATDQFLRFATSARRYFDEVRMHKEMGLNLIRVWGGGLAERPEFYDAADALGVLVYQEFWMTGDNNGRWGGSYSWPADHAVYLGCVRDTIRMVRNHPSLLLWGGGNELSPAERSPAPDIAAGIRGAVRELDPGRFYIPSSMSGGSSWDPDYALAPKDGPYGFLALSEFYERNPGLHFPDGERADQLRLGFQPEIGSSSNPVFASVRRFANSTDLKTFPQERAGTPGGARAPPLFEYHMHIPFTDDSEHDHVYAYGAPGSLAEYCLQAQLAQFQQFKTLFEGYQDAMWHWYTAVIFWKTQSPWPTFRGAMYDPWLATTGGFWGVRSAVRSPVHVQLNLKTLAFTVVNKGSKALTNLQVEAAVYNMSGAEACPTIIGELLRSDPSSSSALTSEKLTWPKQAGESAMLVRLTLRTAHSAIIAQNEYWLSNPSQPQNYRASFGALRHAEPLVHLQCSCKRTSGSIGEFIVEIIHVGHHVVAAAVQLSLEHPIKDIGGDVRVLPSWYSDQYFWLLPGEQKQITIEGGADIDRDLVVRVDGWNIKEVTVLCSS